MIICQHVISGCYGRRRRNQRGSFEQKVTTTLGSIFVLFKPSPENFDGEGKNKTMLTDSSAVIATNKSQALSFEERIV